MYGSITPPEWYRNVIFGVLARGLLILVCLDLIFQPYHFIMVAMVPAIDQQTVAEITRSNATSPE